MLHVLDKTLGRFERRDCSDSYATALSELFEESAPDACGWLDEQNAYVDAIARDPSLGLHGNGVFLLLSLLEPTD